MKKFKFLLAFALVGIIGLSACQEPKERLEESVALKVENNDPLSNEDYTLMINYVGEYAKKAQPLVDDLINNVNLEQAQSKLNELNGEYTALNIFRNKIKLTPISKYSEENKKLLQEYSQYIEFSMPIGSYIQTLNEAAGLLMQAPNDSNGVVAAPQVEEGVSGRGW